MQDVSELLTATERESAEKWKAKHGEKCVAPIYVVTSVVSGYGYRLKVLCEACGTKEDVTDKTGRDYYPHKG